MKDTNNDNNIVFDTNSNVGDKNCSCGANCECKKSNKTLIIVFVVLMIVCLVGGFVLGYFFKSNERCVNNSSNSDVKVEDNVNDKKDDVIEEYDYNDSFAVADKKIVKMTSLNDLSEYFKNGTLSVEGNFYHIFEYGNVNGLDLKLKFIQNVGENGDVQRVTLVLNNKDYILHESNSPIARAFDEFNDFRISEYKDGILFIEYQSNTYGKSNQIKPNISMYAYNKNGKMFDLDDVIVNYFTIDPASEGFVNSEVKCPINVDGDKISYCKEVNEHLDSLGNVVFDIEFREFDGINKNITNTVRDVYSSEQY